MRLNGGESDSGSGGGSGDGSGDGGGGDQVEIDADGMWWLWAARWAAGRSAARQHHKCENQTAIQRSD